MNLRDMPKTVPSVILRRLEGSKCNLPGAMNDEVPTNGYYIFGKAGTGKSHQAALLLSKVLSKRRIDFPICRWVNVPNLLHQIRAEFNVQQGPALVMDHYLSADWLCLDDLGVERHTDWVFETLYLVINHRYENEKTTVITSNLSLTQMKEKLGDDRLTSRIRGMCRPVHLIGDDIRKEIHGTI